MSFQSVVKVMRAYGERTFSRRKCQDCGRRLVLRKRRAVIRVRRSNGTCRSRRSFYYIKICEGCKIDETDVQVRLLNNPNQK